MIHSPGSMPSGNFDEPAVPPTQPAAPEPRSFRLPAEYYSAPLSEVKPIFPKWVPWGCGTAAIVFLVLLFAGGAMLTGPRLNTFIDLMLAMTLGELKGLYAGDVQDAQKAALDAEVRRMRESLVASDISAKDVQPFLQTMQKAIADQKVTAAEVEQLTRAARAAVNDER